MLSLESVEEHRSYAELTLRLEPGESACIALALHRRMIFASDDLAARREAQKLGVKLTGTLGILIRLVREKLISPEKANGYLREMIRYGYRSPVTRLDELVLRGQE